MALEADKTVHSVPAELEREEMRERKPGKLVGLLKARVVDPIVGQLKQGASPSAIALSMALGSVLGLFPVLGATTALCLLAAFALRLNHVVIQAVNYVVYPAQIALLLPFMQLGQRIFGTDAAPIGMQQLRASFEAGWWSALTELWQLILFGIFAWCVVAVPLAAIVYFSCEPLLRRFRPTTPPPAE
ncbi:MAG: hypothetical protein ACI8W7_000343 [Gammaproteobacteria bacterium]|jgi:uncharacterized protein (DUF2062 family)